MKKVIVIALLFITALGVNAQETSKLSVKDDTVLGVSAAYSHSNGIVLDLTQKDPNGIILGFGGSRNFTKKIESSVFAVVGYEVGVIEVKSRFGLRSGNGKAKTVYGGVVSLASAVNGLRYVVGYDNYNKFQAGLALEFK